MKSIHGRTLWIIGASSGIGRALAVELDRRGARLILSARRADHLATLNAELGDRHILLPLDVTDAAAMDGAVAALPQSIDSVVFLAGQYKPAPLDQLETESIVNIVGANLVGPLNLVKSILPVMLRHGRGQIALCASVAGYCGLPNGQPYSATKAAVINLAESLRAETQRRGLDIKLINPGFVRTPMTDMNTFKMPMLIEPGQAATAIADGLQSKAFEIHFPHRFTRLVKLLKFMPYSLYFRLVHA